MSSISHFRNCSQGLPSTWRNQHGKSSTWHKLNIVVTWSDMCTLNGMGLQDISKFNYHQLEWTSTKGMRNTYGCMRWVNTSYFTFTIWKTSCEIPLNFINTHYYTRFSSIWHTHKVLSTLGILQKPFAISKHHTTNITARHHSSFFI